MLFVVVHHRINVIVIMGHPKIIVEVTRPDFSEIIITKIIAVIE